MGIRKTGSVTGQVTGVEPPETMRHEAAREDGWGPQDDQDLAAENEAADQGGS